MRPNLSPIPWNKTTLTGQQRQMVAQAIIGNYPRNEIARALGITVKTLKRILDDEPELTNAVDAAKEAEEAELRDCLMRSARGGSDIAALFLLKTRHGYRDRDDGKAKVDNSGCGVLLVPGTMPFDEWSLAAIKQQAKYREKPEFESDAEFRSQSLGVDGLLLQRTEESDLPH